MVFYRTPWTRLMAFHGTASVLQGTPWHSMELHDIPWNFMAFHGTSSLLHGTPWNSMALHGAPWILHGTPWHSMEHHAYSIETPWHSMELHGYSMDVSWNSMDFHRFPWISMDFHGIPWRYFTRDGPSFHQCEILSASSLLVLAGVVQ